MKTFFGSVAVVMGLAAMLLILEGAARRSDAQEGKATAGKRVRGGLLALYDFSATQGDVVRDRSGVGEAVDLRIANTKVVRRVKGSLEVRGATQIRSKKPALKLINTIRRTGEITIEAWIRPAKTNQTGPARIVTLSKSANERNFTLGQDGDRFDVRLRTTRTSSNGIPSTMSRPKSLTRNLTHVVYARDRSGAARVFVNGKSSAQKRVAGATSNWNATFGLALANETTNDRPWLGTYYLVAIYGRDLSPNEVAQNFKAGPGGIAAPDLASQSRATMFENEVAPLLLKHCFECHDGASKKGALDLSNKVAALAGGENGKAIVPGKSAESLLWRMIEGDDMPAKRTPLTAKEKALLKKWIDNGAFWSVDVIDPALYQHDRRAGNVWVQRLTLREYIETVRSAVGVDIAEDARRLLPPDLRADGFSNTAYNLGVDLKHVDAYAKLAQMIVARMDTVKFARKFSRSRKLTDDDMRALIAKMGKQLLRGPLSEREIVSYRGISTTVASAGGGFKDAVGYILEAMLQSPRFIYRIENQRGDGTAWPVGEYELASRLSYILWGGPPDDELMRAAGAGELGDRSQVAAQVKRMLEDPRAVERSAQFIHEWLDLGRLDNLRPDPQRFPGWDAKLAADMREESIAFFKEVAWKQKRPLAELLNAQFTHASPRLAKHYGLQPKGDGWARYDLSSTPARGGLLTQGSVLTVGGDEASMVTRGLFILHDVLRGVVRDPPPGTDTTPVPTRSGLTQRGVAQQRIANKSCGGCHSKFEPLAFSLEKFNGVGVFREKDEHGNKLRDDGEIRFPGAAKPVKFQSSAELMDLLAKSDRVQENLTWKVTQFALGRPLVAADARAVKQIHAESRKGGGTYASLITAIVMSDLVQMTKTENTQ